MEKITKKIALEKVRFIKLKAELEDSETAHIFEDLLHYEFICSVAYGLYQPDELIEVAEIVKSTVEIRFHRWYS